mmetsp:Transcript_48061/g.154033  ORF Transcript_48061/g.154033 Transcript_48061/m.154033 type:complete len:135 (+) Transcript_48061:346-750(+)
MACYKFDCSCKAVSYTVDAVEPQLAVNCWCGDCRGHSGQQNALAVFNPQEFHFVKGEDNLLKFESSKGTFKCHCKSCGAYVNKILSNGAYVAPIYALKNEGGAPQLHPKCHIFAAHKGPMTIPDDGLPRHDEFP